MNYGQNKSRVDDLYGNLQTVALGSYWYLSVEARKGTTTGISAYDRAATVQALVNPATKAHDLRLESLMQAELASLLARIDAAGPPRGAAA